MSAIGNRNSGPQPWAQRLEHHSLTWIGAFRHDTLIGFVHACWDGGSHAFVLDTIVDTTHRRQGIGQALVRALIDQAVALRLRMAARRLRAAPGNLL
jgi:ribosomal protein S18 acetylase RimI-like enzyme